MKTQLIAVASLLFIGCSGSMPQFPNEVNKHYAVIIENKPVPEKMLEAIVNVDDIPVMSQSVECLEFDIVSTHPYKIKFNQVVDLNICNGVGGYKTKDMVLVLNWVDDVTAWAETKKKCFK